MISNSVRTKLTQKTTLREKFVNEDGAIDLASIIVGIIVLGIVGGIAAAVLFAVIPWTQNNAAKQQLASVVTAENAYTGDSAGRYTAILGKYLNEENAGAYISSDEKNCYVAFKKSDTGNYYYITSKNPKPAEVKVGDSWPSKPSNLDSSCPWPAGASNVDALPNVTISKLVAQAVVDVANPANYTPQTVNFTTAKGYTVAGAWNLPSNNSGTLVGQEFSFKLQQAGTSLTTLSGDGTNWTNNVPHNNLVDNTGKLNTVVATVSSDESDLYVGNNITAFPTPTGKITKLNVNGSAANAETITGSKGNVYRVLAWDKTLTPSQSKLILNYFQQLN